MVSVTWDLAMSIINFDGIYSHAIIAKAVIDMHNI